MRLLLLSTLALAACTHSAPVAAPVEVPAAAAQPAKEPYDPADDVPDVPDGRLIDVDGALPFRTLLPEGVTLARAASGEGESTAFQIGGHDALVFFVPAPSVSAGDLRAYASVLAGDSARVSAGSPSGPFRWEAGGRRHILTSGEHDGRRYMFVKSFFGTDNGREVRLTSAIQAGWTWQPSGEPLR